MERIRFMWGVGRSDLAKVRELGCNVAHHPTFDGMSDAEQNAYITECKRLGLKVCWSAYGGSEFAKGNRDRTILRWKDDPVVFAWYIISEPANTKMTIADQEAKYAWIKSLDTTKPVMIDWSLWSHDRDTYPYRTIDVTDILMIYSYPYEDGHTPESAFNRYFTHLSDLNTRNLPVIPLLQGFYGGRYQNPTGTIQINYNKWKEFLESKGWFGGHAGFYTWSSGSYVSDIKRNTAIQQEIKELNTGEGPDEIITKETIIHSCNVKISYQVSSFPENNNPLTCPNCGMALGVEGTRGSQEIVEKPIPEPGVFYASASGTVKGDGTVTLGTLAIEPQTREEWKRRGFVSFDTSPVPDNAIIDEAYLRVYPFDCTYGGHHIRVDYCLYGTMDAADLNRVAEAENIALINAKDIKGQWVESGKFVNINKGGLSQYRLVGTEYTKGTTWLRGANATEKPELHISYHLPEETNSVLITCPKCRSQLKLTISSIPEKNTEQFCPVCGEPAD